MHPYMKLEITKMKKNKKLKFGFLWEARILFLQMRIRHLIRTHNLKISFHPFN